MKTKFTFLVVLIFSLVYVGCDKSEPVKPDSPTTVVPFKITQINFNPNDSVVIGGQVSVDCITNADSGNVQVNQKSTYSFKGGLFSRTFVLITNTEFIITFYKNDSSFSVNHTNKVYEIIIPPPPPTPPEISSSANSSAVNYSDSTEITITLIQGDLDSISVSPELHGFTGMPGTFWTGQIFEDSIYEIIAYGPDGQDTVFVPITRNYFPLPWGAPLIKCERIVTGVFYSYTGEEPWTPLPSVRLGTRYTYYNDMIMKFVDVDGSVAFADWDIENGFLYIEREDPHYHEIVMLTDSICKLKLQLNDFWVMYVMEPYVGQ